MTTLARSVGRRSMTGSNSFSIGYGIYLALRVFFSSSDKFFSDVVLRANFAILILACGLHKYAIVGQNVFIFAAISFLLTWFMPQPVILVYEHVLMPIIGAGWLLFCGLTTMQIFRVIQLKVHQKIIDDVRAHRGMPLTANIFIISAVIFTCFIGAIALTRYLAYFDNSKEDIPQRFRKALAS